MYYFDYPNNVGWSRSTIGVALRGFLIDSLISSENHLLLIMDKIGKIIILV